jgi:hypothetical protein
MRSIILTVLVSCLISVAEGATAHSGACCHSGPSTRQVGGVVGSCGPTARYGHVRRCCLRIVESATWVAASSPGPPPLPPPGWALIGQ